MSPAAAEQSEDDPRVLDAVREYHADLEAGRAPDRAAYVARHPELAGALCEYFDGIDLVHAAGLAMGAAKTPVTTSPVAEPLGDFRIVREIGQGGMGVVYEAVQLSLGRRVAVKVLPFAAALDSRRLQRFRTEAHAAAQLHHANIVPVYAVGCERGTHFYAMQLIEGRSLDAVIREFREAAAIDSPHAMTRDQHSGPTAGTEPISVPAVSKTNREREEYGRFARIGLQVADALEYAHDAGVIHRDIKPANLLLDVKGNVWVTDFGLAQVSAADGMTRTGDVFGTLRYMSPEQASGRRLEVDHRTDVYSLGATMYELLTRQPLFDGQDRQALLHQILTREPRPLRAINRSIPVELETIVLKAVAKAPEDRYLTAGEMAADLRRFLEDRPILARRPSLFERGRKCIRRHPAYLGAASVVLGLGIVTLGAGTALVMRERDRTEDAYRREKQRADEAEQRFELARLSADELIRIENEELAFDMSQLTLRRRLLHTAVNLYQKFIDLRQNDPAAKAELEIVHDKLRSALSDLALLRGAERHMILGEDAVMEELNLGTKQRQKLAAIFKEIQSNINLQAPMPASPAERSQKMLNDMRAHEDAIGQILNAAQFHRLKQIALQRRGVDAFRDPDVESELGLDANQCEEIRELISNTMAIGPGKPPGDWRGPPGKDDWFRPPGPPRGDNFRFPPPGGERKPGGPLMGNHKNDDETLKKILALLRPDQLARWRELTGKEFKR